MKYVPASAFAAIYTSLGEMEKAFEWFEKAIAEREFMVQRFDLDLLRSNPRYHALLRKMNLEP